MASVKPNCDIACETVANGKNKMKRTSRKSSGGSSVELDKKDNSSFAKPRASVDDSESIKSPKSNVSGVTDAYSESDSENCLNKDNALAGVEPVTPKIDNNNTLSGLSSPTNPFTNGMISDNESEMETSKSPNKFGSKATRLASECLNSDEDNVTQLKEATGTPINITPSRKKRKLSKYNINLNNHRNVQ